MQEIGSCIVKLFLLALTGLMIIACSNDSSNRIPLEQEEAGLAVRSDSAPDFLVKQLRYQGRVAGQRGVREFLGIPFAQPPVGDLRWSAPQPVKESEGTVIATRFAPACMQGPHMANWYKGVIESFGEDAESFPTPEVSEDCLYLNIWSPKTEELETEAQNGLPVFVFIHGGSNKGGWSYEPNYDGQRMASRGAVVVTIGYRLGVFGFFSHPELEITNFALLDQIAALKWIKENISKVGGDPDNVTIAGESAGASNISFLMTSPLADGLFQRVIHQSGGWAMFRTNDRKSSDLLGMELAKSVLQSTEHDVIKKLRRVPAGEILNIASAVYKDHYFDPVIDGHSVTQTLASAAKVGQLAKVDLLIGTNANEALMYLDANQTVDGWMADNLSDRFPEISKKAILQRLSPEADARQKLDQLATGFNYTCPSLALAEANAKHGSNSWVYQFTKSRDGELGSQMGSYHGAELPYVFDTHDDWLPTSSEDYQLTDSLIQYWLNFAATGDPNTSTLPEWTAYTQAGDAVQYLGVDVKSHRHLSHSLCELFEY